jgi:hypothetical protein
MNYDEWNNWSIKSDNVKFKSNGSAIGDGEEKLGKEFGVTPLGQNVSYDLLVLDEKWEVKKLDSDDSFRLGVEVSSSYRNTINTVSRIFQNLIEIESEFVESFTSRKIKTYINDITSISGRSRTSLIDGLNRNEVSESNLNKADKIIKELTQIMITELQYLELFSSHNGTKLDYDMVTAFKKLKLEPITIQNILQYFKDPELYNKVLITSVTKKDVSVFDDCGLKKTLNKIVRDVFKDIRLVLVHETKGYMPIIDLNKIFCNRITSGNPRCKLR